MSYFLSRHFKQQRGRQKTCPAFHRLTFYISHNKRVIVVKKQERLRLLRKKRLDDSVFKVTARPIFG